MIPTFFISILLYRMCGTALAAAQLVVAHLGGEYAVDDLVVAVALQAECVAP